MIDVRMMWEPCAFCHKQIPADGRAVKFIHISIESRYTHEDCALAFEAVSLLRPYGPWRATRWDLGFEA